MTESSIVDFDDFLRIARAQTEPQRLLFVFAGTELPDDSTPEQRSRFASGAGGALVPLMCVDKNPGEVAGFAALVEESRAMGQEWALVFVAALAGRGAQPPTSADTEAALHRMVDAIKEGSLGAYLPFDRNGHPVQFV